MRDSFSTIIYIESEDGVSFWWILWHGCLRVHQDWTRWTRACEKKTYLRCVWQMVASPAWKCLWLFLFSLFLSYIDTATCSVWFLCTAPASLWAGTGLMFYCVDPTGKKLLGLWSELVFYRCGCQPYMCLPPAAAQNFTTQYTLRKLAQH